MEDWNVEPKDLAQAGWLETVDGKVAAISGATCAGGARAVHDYFVLSEAMAPVSLTLTATSWGHRVLARRRPTPFPTEVPVGPQRQEEQFEWTWAADDLPVDLEQAWLEWLRAAEAAWCRIHDLCGTRRRPFLGRSKGLVIEHVSLGQATRNDTPQLGVPLVAWWRRWLAAWPLGGRGEPRRVRCNSQSTRSLQSRYPILAPGIQAGIFRHKKLWHTLCAKLQPVGTGPSRSQGPWFSSRVTHNKQLTLWLWIRRVVGGNGRRKLARGPARAAHGFSKVGLDVGDGDGLAGPQPLVNQMGTWLPLWLDPRRANAKQLADQEDMGEPLPRPSLEEVDNVCKTYKHTAGLGHDCINPKASRIASTLHRPAHGVRGKASQAFELHTKAGAFSRPTNAPPFHSGPLGPSFQVAVGPLPPPNSCWQLTWKQWPHASPLTGSGTWSTTFRGTWRELPRWCKSSLPKRPGFWWKASRHAICLSPRANQKSSSMARTSSSMHFCSSWSVLGIDECDTARNVGADLQLGRRRRALVVKGRLARAAKRTKRVTQVRKAGAHTRNLTLTGSIAGVLWGSEVLGFTLTQLQSVRVDAAKATYRLSRGQNAATTMLANAKAAGAKNIDPAFRHHRQVILAWATGVWEGTPDLDTMQAALCGSLARLSHLKRPWCGATDAVATFVLTLFRLGWSA